MNNKKVDWPVHIFNCIKFALLSDKKEKAPNYKFKLKTFFKNRSQQTVKYRLTSVLRTIR